MTDGSYTGRLEGNDEPRRIAAGGPERADQKPPSGTASTVQRDANGRFKRGHVAFHPDRFIVPQGASKGSVIALTRTAAQQLARNNLNVNAVCPGATVTDPLPPALEQGVRTTITARRQGEAEIPLDALRTTAFPKLVTSGGHHPVSEAICDVLYRELKTERAIIRLAGHTVPLTGAPFNERLEAFLNST